MNLGQGGEGGASGPPGAEKVEAGWIQLPGAAEMEVFRAQPQGAAFAPTILLLLQEIFGVNAFIRGFAQSLAAQGYQVLAPDLFWRVRPRISLGYEPPDRVTAAELMKGFDTSLGLADIQAVVTWARAQRPHARIAALGFCLGGKLAALLGARGGVDCGIAFYGVELEDYVCELGRSASRLLLHFGERDAQIPLSLVERIRSQAAGNANVEIHVHPGAPHGFFNASRPDRFHADAAARAGARTTELLKETLR